MVDSFYQQLFIRLHRPYLVRSYRDEQYFQSRIVISTARQIVGLHRKLLAESGGSREFDPTLL